MTKICKVSLLNHTVQNRVGKQDVTFTLEANLKKPFLRDASQQPSVARDVDNTFICDANGEVWELN